jgi:hypothetical protein
LIESSLLCARCLGRRYPPTEPRPVLDTLELQIPLLGLTQNADAKLYEEHMRKSYMMGNALTTRPHTNDVRQNYHKTHGRGN